MEVKSNGSASVGKDGKDFSLLLEVTYKLFGELCQDNAHYWNFKLSDDTSQTWLQFHHQASLLPDQGWKLHISADVSNAEQILRQTLPILLRETAHFKVLTSLEYLTFLNRGGGGISQIGKFITIYPINSDQAVKMAVLLDRATLGLGGPLVPSDRPLRHDSRVSYRYGSFRNTIFLQELNGDTTPAILNPENQLVPDRRSSTYLAPDGISDPFISAGIAPALPVRPRILRKRYCIIQAISSSVDNTIYMAADLDQGRSCIIKGPGAAWQHNPFVRSRQGIIRHEAEVLAELGSHTSIPSLYELFEQERDLYLVIQDMAGETLEAYMHKSRKQGPLPLERFLIWAKQLLEILVFVHEQGFVYTDLKSSNVIVRSQEKLALIDFGQARKANSTVARGLGTRGYASPQLRDTLLATVQDDIYSFGALLYFLLTGAEPSLAPDADALLKRPLEWMRPGIPTDLIEIIQRCLAPAAQTRYASLQELGWTLAKVRENQCRPPSSDESAWLEVDTNKVRDHYHFQASDLRDTICAFALSTDTNGCYWRSSHPRASKRVRRDIYLGNAGVILALAELARLEDGTVARELLVRATHWLMSTFSPDIHLASAGLYTGEASVGTALLHAGHVLQDEQLIAFALEHGRLIAGVPQTTPDVMNGAAGRLRFHLLLWDETRSPEHLHAALACGKYLLDAQCSREGDGIAWIIPAGHSGLSGDTFLGYAYGVAGIADSLLDLYEATDDKRFLSAIQGAQRWLQQQAIPSLEDKSGLNWPISEKQRSLAAPSWVHGVAGIGRFFLHSARMNLFSNSWDIARRAATTVIHAARWTDPTQNHGLAGNIEFLLDMHQATGEYQYLKEAHAFAHLLEAFAHRHHERLVFSSDLPDVFTPDYMFGYGGIALCFLRLSMPTHMPHLLSRDGFRFHRSFGGKYGILASRA